MVSQPAGQEFKIRLVWTICTSSRNKSKPEVNAFIISLNSSLPPLFEIQHQIFLSTKIPELTYVPLPGLCIFKSQQLNMGLDWMGWKYVKVPLLRTPLRGPKKNQQTIQNENFWISHWTNTGIVLIQKTPALGPEIIFHVGDYLKIISRLSGKYFYKKRCIPAVVYATFFVSK